MMKHVYTWWALDGQLRRTANGADPTSGGGGDAAAQEGAAARRQAGRASPGAAQRERGTGVQDSRVTLR